MRISDWSSDVCSSDLETTGGPQGPETTGGPQGPETTGGPQGPETTAAGEESERDLGTRIDAIRRGHRRRRPGRSGGGHPTAPAFGRERQGDHRLRSREGLGSRRPHPLRRGAGAAGAERADPRLAGEGRAAEDRKSTRL